MIAMGYNASLRKSPIANDLSKSDYHFTWGRYEYYFSSASHAIKFEENVTKKEEWLSDSLSRRFHMKVDANYLADFQLYMQIEGRGFRIIDNLTGNVLDSPNMVSFVAVS